MKRAYRLRRPGHFHRVRREGRTHDAGALVLHAALNRRRSSRCGFVVSKRLGGAVVRNRCKRRVREAVRLVYAEIAPGWDLVFVVRSPAVAKLAFSSLQTSVCALIQRAGAWQGSRTAET